MYRYDSVQLLAGPFGPPEIIITTDACIAPSKLSGVCPPKELELRSGLDAELACPCDDSIPEMINCGSRHDWWPARDTPQRHLLPPGQRGHSPQRHAAAGVGGGAVGGAEGGGLGAKPGANGERRGVEGSGGKRVSPKEVREDARNEPTEARKQGRLLTMRETPRVNRGVKDTGGGDAAGVGDTGRGGAAGVADTGGRDAAGVGDTGGGARVQRGRGVGSNGRARRAGGLAGDRASLAGESASREVLRAHILKWRLWHQSGSSALRSAFAV